MASAFSRRPFLNVACGVKMGSRFFSPDFSVSYSSFVSSPRRSRSSPSAISAQTSVTSSERMAWWNSSGVHSRTTRLFTLLLIPNFIALMEN